MKRDQKDGRGDTFLVRFHGVRGSHPVPRPAAAHFGGNTSCIEILSGGFRVVFDLGTGLIPLGDAIVASEGPSARALFLVSHLHHDHTMGFPFFKPVYNPRSELLLAGPGIRDRSFQDVLEGTFANPYFPVEPRDMPSRRTYITLAGGDLLAWRDPAGPLARVKTRPDPSHLLIRVLHNPHHPNGGVLNFRLEREGKSLVLATDVEVPAKASGGLVKFARGADLLVHDAQYTEDEYANGTQGWGHSTWRMAADVARRAKVGRLVLYHHDPAHDDPDVEDIERRTREVFADTLAAAEGLEIRL